MKLSKTTSKVKKVKVPHSRHFGFWAQNTVVKLLCFMAMAAPLLEASHSHEKLVVPTVSTPEG